MFNSKLIGTNNAAGGGAVAEWLIADTDGKLFYTNDPTGLTGWTNSGQNVGSPIYDGVWTGSVWLVGTEADGVWQTTDPSATSGWTQVAIPGSGYVNSISWTPSGVVATGDGRNVLYTTDPTGATGWTQFPNLTQGDLYLGAANNGSQTFFGLWSNNSEYAYSSSLFGGTVTYLVDGFSGDQARGTHYDPVNDYYFIYGKSPGLKYRTTIGGSSTAVNTGSTDINGMDFNGTYYLVTNGSNIRYSTNALSGWSSQSLSGIGVSGTIRITANNIAWSVGTVNDGMAFATNPSSTWTLVSKPTGYTGSVIYRVVPSKRPYYNAITNLGY